jgi:hypothetical protein
VSIHPPITGAEAADRLAIRELFDACAQCADRRDAKGQMALFTENTHFVVYMDARNPEPTQDLHGRDALAPVFDALNAYVATMHFNGQSTVELAGRHHTDTGPSVRRVRLHGRCLRGRPGVRQPEGVARARSFGPGPARILVMAATSERPVRGSVIVGAESFGGCSPEPPAPQPSAARPVSQQSRRRVGY